MPSSAAARAGLIAALACALLALSAVEAFASPPPRPSGTHAESTICPTFPCWVINTEGLYSLKRRSKHGSALLANRFANPSTFPVLQADKVPPSDPDWDFYTAPPSKVMEGGAHRAEQFWNFQTLWLSCPPPGSPGPPEHFVPPPDVNAFFLDLETGQGSREKVDVGDPLIVAYQAWVKAKLGLAIGPNTRIESQHPRTFLSAFGAYVHGLSLRPFDDPCYRRAPVAVQVPSVGLGGTDLEHDPTKTDRQNFLDLNIAGAAAHGTDMLGIQWQWDELNIPVYQQENATTAAQARAVQPRIAIIADLSTLPARCDPARPATCVTAEQLMTAYTKVQEATQIDGFYMGAYADDSDACHSTDPPQGGEEYPLCHSDISLQAAWKFLVGL